MKLKNKKFRIFSAIASMSAIATLASVSITSCTKNANAENDASVNIIEEKDNGVYSTVTDNGVYSTVTFNGNEGIIKGDVSVKVRTGKPFGSIKAPTATREGYAFAGWYTQATGGNKMEPTTPITDSLMVYAHWTDIQAKELKFDAGTTGAKLQGPTTVEILPGQNFSQVSRPDAILANRDFKGWAYDGTFLDEDAEEALSYDSIDASKLFTPVFYEPKAYEVQITADENASDNTIALQYTSQLTAKVIGQTGVSQTVTWSSSDQTVLTVNDDGIITPIAEGTATITATSKIDGVDKSGTIDIEVVKPTAKYTENVYVTGKPTATAADGYWQVDMSTLCTDDNTKPIKLTLAGTTTDENVDKTSFDMPIYIGADIWYIPSFFLEGCSGFNSDITFLGNNVIYIGESFMGGCSSFAKSFALPNNIMVILNDFMYGCSSFATAAATPFTLPSTLTYVGDSFMVNCDNVVHVAVNCDIDVIHADEAIDTLTVDSTAAAAYSGLVITGTVDLAQFKVKFPQLTDAPIYRIYK